ncbi:MAG: primase-helicase family protein [Rikenellaceae bacterium]
MEDKYIRVGTTLYKIVQKPLQSGDFMEIRVPWNYDTLRQDHSKEFLSQIEKYDGFCCVPSHIDYKPIIGTFYNDYQPINIVPKEGDFPKIKEFLIHIFQEQYEMALDYFQLLYTNPLQRLPIVMLVSPERNTGKTTFLNLIKAMFGSNVTFNTNSDFRSQFNSDWATKLVVVVDEVLLNSKEDSERIKNLSTARSYKAEAKGKDRCEVEFFAKFAMTSNNELAPIYIEKGETRYWVRRIYPYKGNAQTDILGDMVKEIPALLWFFLHRTLSTKEASRMWFDDKLLLTDALRKMINHNRNKIEVEMMQIVVDILDIKQVDQYKFCISDMAHMLEMRGHRVQHTYIRRILQNSWNLKPSEPQYYIGERLTLDGTFFTSSPTTGRCYTIQREQLNKIMLI